MLKAPYGDLPDLNETDPEPRHRLPVERHDVGRARAERRLDRRTTARA